MRYFRASKRDILSLYIREVPLILNRIRIERKNEAIDRLNDKLLQLQFMTVTAGMCPDVESIEKLRSGINEQLEKLSPATEKSKQDPYEQLKALQQKMANNRTKRM